MLNLPKVEQKILDVLNQREDWSSETFIDRIEVPCQSVNLLDWLNQQTAVPRLYWSDRQSELEFAAIGQVDVQNGNFPGNYHIILRELHQKLLRSHPKVRYFGGFRFDPRQEPAAEWKSFGRYQFIVPRFEIVRQGNRTTFAFNFRQEAGLTNGDIRRQFQEGLQSLRTVASYEAIQPFHLQERRDFPDLAGWTRMVETALQMFRETDLRKIVLARTSLLKFDRELNPVLLIKQLQSLNPHTYNFLFQPGEEAVFIGASPERLYFREKRQINSEAVAGTRPRGKSDSEDQALGEELLNSPKEILEHELVSERVLETLKTICTDVKPLHHRTLLKLPRVQHIYSNFRGILANGASDGDIIARLHPTPAVGGHPQHLAIHQIARLEPFDRGWYAGPLGWVSREAAEFCVAIRSALIRKKEVYLYVGAGIVPGSDPQAEWAELESKILNFARIFDLK